MTNAAKAFVWSAEYQPWGAVQSLSGPLTLDLRFPGQWFQLEAGLHYNWHRHYDASLGRYTQPDPLGFVDGPSVYGYAGGNAIGFVDPDGRFRIGPRPYVPLPQPTPKPTPKPRSDPNPPPPQQPPRPNPPRPGEICPFQFEQDGKCYFQCPGGAWVEEPPNEDGECNGFVLIPTPKPPEPKPDLTIHPPFPKPKQCSIRRL